ncbi:unnamed protein product [Caenorhabditis sp. 36 PRJEB53466]|nr:unnamed protein product [Caenorhabditis sp. 36 PRJEB53466]
MNTLDGTNSIKEIGLLRNLEFLMIDDIRDVTDVTGLFQLQNLRVLIVPATPSFGPNLENEPSDRPFIRLFQECLENGLTLPQLRYFDCSETTIDVPYDEIVGKLPKLEHFTCIGGTFADVSLPSHRIDTVAGTVKTLEHYSQQKCHGMLLLVLRLNPMSQLQPDMPECSPDDLRKFRDTLHKIMNRKGAGMKLAAFVGANYSKLLRAMIDSDQFSRSEIYRFVHSVLPLFRKLRRFQFPLRNKLYRFLMETVTMPGVDEIVPRPFCSKIVEHALHALSEHALRESALACLFYHTSDADLTQLSREDVKMGCKYLVENMYAQLSDPSDEVAYHFAFRSLMVLAKLVALEAFEEPLNVRAGAYSPRMISFIGQLLNGDQLRRFRHIGVIEEAILFVLRQIVGKDEHPSGLYDKSVLNNIGFFIRQRLRQDAVSVDVTATAISILAKLILSPQRIEDGKAEFYSCLVLEAVQWLLPATKSRVCRTEWHKISDECEAAPFMGTVAEHVYTVREYVRSTKDAPLYVQHVGMREVVRKLSSGRWNDEPVDGWIVEMAIGIRRRTEPGYARAEKRKAERAEEPDDETEIKAKKEKPELEQNQDS